MSMRSLKGLIVNSTTAFTATQDIIIPDVGRNGRVIVGIQAFINVTQNDFSEGVGTFDIYGLTRNPNATFTESAAVLVSQISVAAAGIGLKPFAIIQSTTGVTPVVMDGVRIKIAETATTPAKTMTYDILVDFVFSVPSN